MEATPVVRSFSLESIPVALPVFTVVAYAIGFVINNSYLSSFGVFNDNLVDASYLKAGLLYTFIVAPPILLLHGLWIKPTDNWNVVKLEYPRLAVGVADCCLVLSSIILFFEPRVEWLFLVFSFLFGLSGMVWLYTTSHQGRTISPRNRHLAQLVIPVGIMALIAFEMHFMFALYVIVGLSSLTFLMLRGISADNKANFGAIGVIIVSQIFAPAWFGKAVYAHIPRQLGGGSPVEAKILLSESALQHTNVFGLGSDRHLREIEASVVYATNDWWVLKIGDQTVVLNKEMVDGFSPTNEPNSK